ncbi:MAG: hypothetical protein FJ404_17335 [Verrucomicrobia bacterium]|nr:hypothetical protein [Verrucomicrobiota bacterium]
MAIFRILFLSAFGFLLLPGWYSSVAQGAEAGVEGVVKLPAPKPGASMPARYQGGKVSAPVDPPAAIVYLEGDFPVAPAAPTLVKLEQKNLQFTPNLMAIREGTTVAFPNLDDEFHNVLSGSRAKKLDLGRYRKDEKPPTVTFDKAGVVDLHCEIHKDMRANIVVLKTPYFVKTSPDGRYRLENLPS